MASSTTVDANAGIIATSLHQTVFLSSTGDVLVCRNDTSPSINGDVTAGNDYEPQQQRIYAEDGFRGHNERGGINGNSRVLFAHDNGITMVANQKKQQQQQQQQRIDIHKEDEETMACCCQPEGLCGGDVVVNGGLAGTKLSYNRTKPFSAATTNDAKQLDTHTTTQLSTTNAGESSHRGGIVAYTNSSDNNTHHDNNEKTETTLSMKTMSTSIEDNDAFNRTANMMSLGEDTADRNDSWYHNIAVGDRDDNHKHYSQQKQQQLHNYNHVSPTPIMSFDYSSYYEPSTPEHKYMLPSTDEKMDGNNSSSSLGNNGKRDISMPNLTTSESLDNHHNHGAILLPLQQQTIQSCNNPIRNPTTIQSKKMESSSQKQHEFSPATNSNSNALLSSIPTFLNHLSQVTIQRISAHPQGQHVLLVSNEGMLFSFGSNEHGQLGTGRTRQQNHHQQNAAYYVNEPMLITPLLEKGGKTVNCAAGVDYSLVVVRTERSRIINANNNRRRHYSFQKKTASSKTTSPTTTATASSSTALKEFKTTHEQMYAFGCNENNKLGLLDPEKKQTNNGYELSSRRRRSRKNRNSTDSNTSANTNSPEPAELVSSPSSSSIMDSPDSFAVTASTDVYLPRRTALHCEVILKNDGSDNHAQQIHINKTKVANGKAQSSLPYGIVSVAAASHHSAAVVKRPCGSVEVYTWGRGEDGQLGIFTPSDNNISNTDTSSSPSRGWESLCCTSMEHNNDASTLNSLIDEDVSLNEGVTKTQSQASITTPHFVGTPTLVPSLSLVLSPEQSSYPPLHQTSKSRPRSPRKNPKKTSPIKRGKQNESVLTESEYIVKVALGESCTHVVTSNGRWLVFGSNSNGLLALGGYISNVYRPVEVELPMAFGHEKMASVSIGDTHGIALARSGRAFSWGTSAQYALGLKNQSFVPIPHPIHIPNPLRESALNLAITRHLVGEAKARTESLNSGLGVEEAGRMTDSNPVAYVHAGKGLSILILRSGSIHTCGVPSGRLSNDATPTKIFGGIRLWRRGI